MSTSTRSPTRIELPRLHTGQRTIYEARKRRNVLRCGRRYGKTIFGEVIAATAAIEGSPVGWFAPTYKYLQEPWRDLNKWLAPAIGHSDKQEKRIELVTGGHIDFWTMDSDNPGRGRKYKLVIVDESGLVPSLLSIWWEAIRPTLNDLRGDAWFLGTPKGRRGFQELFLRGEQGEEGWASFMGKTRDNPAIPKDEIDEAEREYNRAGLRHIFLQEYEGVPADDGGNPFGMAAIARCVTRFEERKEVGPAVVFGVDLAKSQDFTVVIGLDSNGYVAEFERWQSDWGQTRRRIARIIGKTQAYIDSTGVGDPLVEEMQRDGLNVEGVNFGGGRKQQMMEALAAAIQQTELGIPNGVIRNEMESYEYEYSKRGVTYSAPAGLNDDAVCALALANRGRGERVRNDFSFDVIEF